MTIQPTVVVDGYLIKAVIPRQGARPIVVTSVRNQYGWQTCWRDRRLNLRWSLVSTRDGAVAEVIRVAKARHRRGAS